MVSRLSNLRSRVLLPFTRLGYRLAQKPNPLGDRLVRRIDIDTGREELTLYRLGDGQKRTWEFVELNQGQHYPDHRHQASDARLRVVDGQGDVFLNGERRAFGPGDVIDVPAGAWHGFQVGDGADAVLLSAQEPPIYDSKTGKIDLQYRDEVEGD